MPNFQALEAPPTDPRAFGGWGFRLQTPKTAPPLRISGYAPLQHEVVTNNYPDERNASVIFKVIFEKNNN